MTIQSFLVLFDHLANCVEAELYAKGHRSSSQQGNNRYLPSVWEGHFVIMNNLWPIQASAGSVFKPIKSRVPRVAHPVIKRVNINAITFFILIFLTQNRHTNREALANQW
jgi:hypothetical protein